MLNYMLIAVANIFVYFIRYGVVDWAPTYLAEVKGYSHKGSRLAYFLYEWAGIPGMLVSGYLSDKVFKGRRAPATILFMFGVLIAVFVYWKNPAGNPLIDNIALVSIDFLIYGPVMMICLHAADLVPKKATGSATGLTGLLGYLIGSSFAGVVMGAVVDHLGWDGGFYTLSPGRRHRTATPTERRSGLEAVSSPSSCPSDRRLSYKCRTYAYL